MPEPVSQTLVEQKAALRRRLRRVRAAIPPAQRRRAAIEALRRLLRLPALRGSRHIAVYLSAGHELGTKPLVRALVASGRQVYVPKVLADGRMHFIRLTPGTPLRRNRYTLAEPAARWPQRAPRQMDLIVLPLVGFDVRGHRLGMGGGYYDRALDFPRAYRRPFLLGYAYAAQQAPDIPAAPHDVRLDAVATERGTLLFRGPRWPTG
ncbi:MAG: 5-formyltetrahydrofolate cyclo-ligase [Gammaproteobacteria bacterium]|nr:5-formyltetrahydrofolate cyclo-ligase [Gammaproteobacteria bacterium]